MSYSSVELKEIRKSLEVKHGLSIPMDSPLLPLSLMEAAAALFEATQSLEDSLGYVIGGLYRHPNKYIPQESDSDTLLQKKGVILEKRRELHKEFEITFMEIEDDSKTALLKSAMNFSASEYDQIFLLATKLVLETLVEGTESDGTYFGTISASFAHLHQEMGKLTPEAVRDQASTFHREYPVTFTTSILKHHLRSAASRILLVGVEGKEFA